MILEHELSQVKIQDVKLDPTNPNRLSQDQMSGLRKAMERFGYLAPIIIDQNNLVADGEHRLLVYKEFGHTEIPCYRVTFSDDSERRLLRQTMNKLRGQHDFTMDAEEMALIYESNKLPDLSALIAQDERTLKDLMLKYKPGLPFGHEDDAQLDQIIDEQLKRVAPDTQLGDIYQLGVHRLICADCTDKRSIDRLFEDKRPVLTITSPPYDNIREYGGDEFEFKTLADQLFVLTLEGGVVVWIVGDATVNGTETLTSFTQALYFKQIGFNVHDTMIYGKTGFSKPAANRYHQTFEYMFVLSKGSPATFNPLKDKPNTQANIAKEGRWMRQTEGHVRYSHVNITLSDLGMRYNVWFYDTGYMHMTQDKIAYEHPAIFPLSLVKDHIQSWSNNNDLVFDPFLGSGTTLIAAEQTGRTCYGVEIDPHYCDIVCKRYEAYTGNKATKL